MAPLMAEPSAKPPSSAAAAAAAANSQRSVPTPFLTKTYQLVDDETIDHVISWNDDGSAFIVWNAMDFARDFLPKHFKHNNFTSFLRQLNTYGFRKVVSDRLEFANECFRKGKKQLLCEIPRRKLAIGSPVSEEQAISSNVTPTKDLAELIDENDRLRREKVRLTEQLVEVKSLCNNIFSLMSSFVQNQFNESLDIFPAKRIFAGDAAAAVGAKRARGYREVSEAAEMAEEETALRLQPPDRSEVKSERINCQQKVDNLKTWRNRVH